MRLLQCKLETDANASARRIWDLQLQQPNHRTPSLKSRWTSCRWNHGNGEGRIGWNPLVEGKIHSECRQMLASPAHKAGSSRKEAGYQDRPTAAVDIECEWPI